MPRDYAQQGGARRQTRSKKAGGGLPGWIWMILGLSLGLAVAAFVYIRRPTEAPLLSTVASAGGDSKPALPTPPAEKPRPGKPGALALPPKEKERFTFYDALKHQEVALPSDAVRSDHPPDSGNTGSAYVIQVAAFRSKDEADKQKASLALLGVESRIETVTVDGGDTFYRVRIGPDRNWPRIQTTMTRLEANGIQAQLLKLN
ncbi:Sporulation related domain-containing protein [Solimonas aquatica]|uniref:Sporulation related domain-containing protein n=1 Tax=Solimonas aquatica TaxID=489703 RepID=A0A1H9KX52_9GAMM|nr:SPOR domain-containing protein [Solimonas aquatica]SER03801.1 Sporulation related domain-containing protein [Solimonas aquatica]